MRQWFFAIKQVKLSLLPVFYSRHFPPSEKRAARYLLENPEEVSKMTLVQFAKKSESSQASIIRLCQRIGLGGFLELKTTLAVQLAVDQQYQMQFAEREKYLLGSDMIEIIEQVFRANIQILRDTFALASDAFNRAFEALLKAKKICFFAIGDAMALCHFAYFKFRKLGYDCYAESDCDLQMIAANYLGEGDVAVAISHSGKSRQVNAAMELAHKNKATTICITKRDRSELVKFCDIKLFTATPDLSVGEEVVARRIADQAILEALFFGVLQAKEPQSLEDIRKTSTAMKTNKS